EHTSYQVKRNAHQTVVSLLNHQAQNHYIFTNRKRHQNKDHFDYQAISLEFPLNINEKAWGKTNLPLLEPTWSNQHVIINQESIEMNKDGLISFAIDIKAYGKYIIELTIASDVSGQAQ